MPLVRIGDRYVDVNIREELEEFEWENAKWTQEKLIASSPFRSSDRNPSFYIDLEGEYAGVFGDSGAYDTYYESGTLPKLLAYLRNESYEDAVDYLLSKYDYEYSNEDVILATPTPLDTSPRSHIMPEHLYAKPIDTEYLDGRGIHPKVVEMMGVFDNGNSIGIPWRDINGNVVAIKYRSKRDKTFYYEEGGAKLSELVYGLNIVVERGISRIAIVEAEIDAMTMMSTGVFAVAIGGARFNEHQADLIIASGVKEVILAGDNDLKGRQFNDKVAKMLRGYVELLTMDYSKYDGCKDVNELGTEGLRRVPLLNVDNKKDIRI